MALKSMKCCCCPQCTVNTLCGCTLRRLCITLDVEESSVCPGGDTTPCSCTGQCIETYFNETEQAWIGTFQCGAIEVDFRYYFERDPYTNDLLFKLRSDALGYPEGEEYVWGPGEFTCNIGDIDDPPSLSTSIPVSLALLGLSCTEATISTRSAFRLRPRCCSTCKCLPECLFADIDICGGGNPQGFSHGILCWNDDFQRYEGFVTENNGTQHDVFVSLRPRCLYVQNTPDSHGGHELVLADPYADVDPYDPCGLPLPAYGDPACTVDSECVVVIEIPDANYIKWFEQSAITTFGLADTCDGFGYIAVGENPAAIAGRNIAGFHIRDAPCERISTPTVDWVCDCKTASSGTGETLLPGGAIPLIGPIIPILLRDCPQTCEACEDFWVTAYRNATLPATVDEPAGACWGYFWAEDDGIASGVCVLLWCDGTEWKAKQYCKTGSVGAYVYTYVGDMTIEVDCIPGTRPQFSATVVECCGRCHPCFLCPWPTPVNLVVTSARGRHNYTGVVAFSGNADDGGINCWVFETGTDRMSLELNLRTCTVRIGCNGTDCITFNCTTTKTLTINSCDPLDITIVATVGQTFCNACGPGGGKGDTVTFHIFE